MVEFGGDTRFALKKKFLSMSTLLFYSGKKKKTLKNPIGFVTGLAKGNTCVALFVVWASLV